MKTEVRKARHLLSVELRSRGANVGYLEWDGKKGKGPDDWLATVGPDFVLAQIAKIEYNTSTGWEAKLLCTDTGKPKPLLFNAMLALGEDPAFAGVLRFDEFALKTIIKKEPPWQRHNRSHNFWTEDDDRHACAWLQSKRIEVTVNVAHEAVESVALQNSYHPVREYLNGLPPWDGEKRVDKWLTLYFGVNENEYSSRVGRFWVLSAVARVMHPGCRADYCLVLEGLQGTFKSQAVEILGAPWTTDSMPDLREKAAKEHIIGVWIVELAELSSLGTADANRIKAFLSCPTDRFRFSYGRRSGDVPRQCVFIGTVNHSQYLRDETGNRRFWPVKTGSINKEGLERDRDQIWAEALELYRGGNKWWSDDLNFLAQAREEQQSRYIRDPWDEKIREHLATTNITSVSEILMQCIGKKLDSWLQADENRVARCLISQGWERKKLRVGEKRFWGYKRVISISSECPS